MSNPTILANVSVDAAIEVARSEGSTQISGLCFQMKNSFYGDFN